MAVSGFAKNYRAKMFSGAFPAWEQTDPEFAELFENFAFDEVIRQDDLDDRTRCMAILAALIGSQSLDAYKCFLPDVLHQGITPAEVQEIVYQAVAYLGLGRVFPFLNATDEILAASEVPLPLESRRTVGAENRIQSGEQAQIDIFGETMRGFSSSGAEEIRHINRWLSANCFGDYYTRKGLDYRTREMLTFCFLLAQGGCEPQLVSHAKANLRIGNDKSFLIKVLSQCLPYIGYPRSLNALRCIEEAAR